MKNQLLLLFLLITITIAGKAQQTTIPMPGTTHGLAVNEKASEFYVTSQDNLLVIDANTRTFKTAFRLPYQGRSVCVSPTGILAVTMLSPQSPIPAVAVIDPAAGTIDVAWDYAMSSIGNCSFSPDGSTLYVSSDASWVPKNPADLQQLTAFVHDSKGWTVSRTWHFLDVGYVANILALDNKVYAIVLDTQTEKASLMVTNTQEQTSPKVITTMPSGRMYGWRWSFSLGPDGRRLYVPVWKNVVGAVAALVVDTASDELVDPLFSTPDLLSLQIVFSGADASFSYWLGPNSVWKYNFRTSTASQAFQGSNGGQSIGLQVIRQPNFDLLAILFQDRLVMIEVPRVPAIFALTNGASFTTDPVVSPGEWVSIFGSLSYRTAVANDVPLPTELEGTRVWAQVGNNPPIALPLVFVSINQINAQFPYEIPVGSRVNILVEGPGNQKSDPVTVTVVATTPALFAWPDRSPILADADGKLIFSVAPASVVTMYATGLGQVLPQVASGAPAPFNPLAWTVNQPQIFVAGRPCEVLYAGLSPGWVGLYQINFQIPADIPAGKQSLVISQAGTSVEYQISISGGSQ